MTPRPALAAVAALGLALGAAAADAPRAVDKALAQQAALADARDLLTGGKPAEAAALLEAHVADADGSRAFLDLLRSAYASEIKKLLLANKEPERVAQLRTKLALLGVRDADPAPAPEAAPAPAPSPGVDLLGEAAALFRQGTAEPKKFDLARELFARAFASNVQLSPEQTAAWAYCRIRVAGEKLNNGEATGPAAAALARDIEEAAAQVPGNAKLQQLARELAALARERAGRAAVTPPAVAAGWQSVDTASFRVWYAGDRAIAVELGRAAEAKREAIFSRWSGPPGGPWEPRCDVYLHADAAGLAAATGLPAGSTGHALVSLDAGRATARRIDLRADDPAAAEVALPRELTHVVLADLFPGRPAPRWAVEGMAVLATPPAEQDRYLRTAGRVRRDGGAVPAAELLDLAAPPADRVTGYVVGSAALVEFFVRWKGEKAFTTFLRDGQRYGGAQAMQRQYGLDARQLEEALGRDAAARAQSP